MKKTILILFLAIFLVGCGKEQNAEIDEKDIVYTTIIGQAEYIRQYADMRELAEVSDLVIYGEVVDSHCKAIHGSVYTLEDVKVEQVLQGNIEIGDTVQVIKEFGIVTLEEYINSLDEDTLELQSEWFTKYSEAERKKLYIQFVATEEIESEMGQKCVYFIRKVKNFYDYEGYCRIAGGKGQYLEIAEGEFTSVYSVASKREEIEEAAEKGITISEEDGETPTYTMESIQKEMREGVDMEGVIPR